MIILYSRAYYIVNLLETCRKQSSFTTTRRRCFALLSRNYFVYVILFVFSLILRRFVPREV